MQQLGTLVVIHVDDGHVRMPRRKEMLGGCQGWRRANHEETMVQGQLDEVYDRRTLVQNERSSCVVRRRGDPASLHHPILRAGRE
jgi:hypothetical protein